MTSEERDKAVASLTDMIARIDDELKEEANPAIVFNRVTGLPGDLVPDFVHFAMVSNGAGSSVLPKELANAAFDMVIMSAAFGYAYGLKVGREEVLRQLSAGLQEDIRRELERKKSSPMATPAASAASDSAS